MLLCLLYTCTNSSCSPHPLHSSLTLSSYWFPRRVQSVHSSVTGPMPAPPNQYVFRAMRRQNLPVRSIVDISRVIPVYIIHIHGRHHSELSRDVPVIARKSRVQEAFPYHLGDVIIVTQTCNDFVLLPLGLAPNVKDQIQFTRDSEGYHDAEGSIVHVRHVWVLVHFRAVQYPHKYHSSTTRLSSPKYITRDSSIESNP